MCACIRACTTTNTPTTKLFSSPGRCRHSRYQLRGAAIVFFAVQSWTHSRYVRTMLCTPFAPPLHCCADVLRARSAGRQARISCHSCAHPTPEAHKLLCASRVLFANSPAFFQERIQELESLVRGVQQKAGMIGAPIYRGGVQFLYPRPENLTSVSIIQRVFPLFLPRKTFHI